MFYTIYFYYNYEGSCYFYKSDKYVMNADETRIELPIKFDAMFLSKGVYLFNLFLNTAKPNRVWLQTCTCTLRLALSDTCTSASDVTCSRHLQSSVPAPFAIGV